MIAEFGTFFYCSLQLSALYYRVQLTHGLASASDCTQILQS